MKICFRDRYQPVGKPIKAFELVITIESVDLMGFSWTNTGGEESRSQRRWLTLMAGWWEGPLHTWVRRPSALQILITIDKYPHPRSRSLSSWNDGRIKQLYPHPHPLEVIGQTLHKMSRNFNSSNITFSRSLGFEGKFIVNSPNELIERNSQLLVNPNDSIFFYFAEGNWSLKYLYDYLYVYRKRSAFVDKDFKVTNQTSSKISCRIENVELFGEGLVFR